MEEKVTMKNILKISSTRNFLRKEKKFQDSAKKIGGIKIDFVCYYDLYYDKGFRFIKNGKLLKDYDINWCSGDKGVNMLQGFIHERGNFKKQEIIDNRRKFNIGNDKFIQLIFCIQNKYKTPNTIFFIIDKIYFNKYIEILEKKFNYPIIAKMPNMNRGEGIFLINNSEELLILFNKNIDNGLIFQEKIKNDGDYRVLVIGDKVIGAIKRYNPNDYRNNISRGGSAKHVQISKKLEKISIDITKKFGLSISGIDYFIDEFGNYSFIEINTLPQYKGFEKSTGISYSEEVLKYFKELN